MQVGIAALPAGSFLCQFRHAARKGDLSIMWRLFQPVKERPRDPGVIKYSQLARAFPYPLQQASHRKATGVPRL